VTLSDINKETLEISRVEVPDFSDFDLTHYPYLAAGTSRSCPFQCKFCAETVNWGTYRKKKSTQVVQELMTLNQQHGTQLFLMCDSLLNPVINPLADELLNWEPVVYWDGYLRVDRPVIDVDTAWRWRRAGFYRARLGVESGSQNVLDRMNKKITVEQIANALTNLARVGIKTTAMWVIGFPGETEADFQQTLDLLEQFKDDIYEADCNPFVYHPAGQVNSREWNQENKKKLLYPRDAREMLLLQTWYWDESPSRQETYERLNRLVQHCKRLGIPNPYSLFDIYNADDRWERLHENAVPSLVTFKNKEGYIDECRGVKKLSLLHKKIQSNVDFAF
jgi:radical SAM superfamily enzyme YgiQ (UPF0313 family)